VNAPDPLSFQSVHQKSEKYYSIHAQFVHKKEPFPQVLLFCQNFISKIK